MNPQRSTSPAVAPSLAPWNTSMDGEPCSSQSLASLVNELDRTLRLRCITEGKSILDAAEPLLAILDPSNPGATRLLLLIAQWVDVGYRDPRFLEALLARFPASARATLSFTDYLRLRMAEAFRDMATEHADAAIETLDLVLRFEPEAPDEAIIALAHFWKGRAHRKRGDYTHALADIVRARDFARTSGDAIYTAVIQIQESWLLFQKGNSKEALRLLADAESVLHATDHFIALGNIESARGRIVRRSGEYAAALEHFNRAIDLYSRGDPHHINVARTLVNAAYVRRLLALQLRKRIDHRTGCTRPDPTTRSDLHLRYQQLCQEGIRDLEQARRIYALHRHSGGVGSVMLNLGSLHLDRGDIDTAAQEASAAYELGQQTNDPILKARARILESAVENMRVEEQLGEDLDLAVHANRARQHADEALELARHTQNLRLLAGAWIACGNTAASDFFQDWESARRCASEAAGLMSADESDHLAEELTALKARIGQASGISDALRNWSEGIVGNKTFQQLSEEFAEIVIPRVWQRENRNISRVARRLSISPKKVRRILRNAGLLRQG